MGNPILHCVNCFRINDVRLANEIYTYDDGTRDGHYFAIYAYGAKQPYCYDCRHHMAALIRLVGMQQQDGIDVSFRNEAEPPMTDEERFLRCRNCGNSGIDMFGQPCACKSGVACGEITQSSYVITSTSSPELLSIPDGARVATVDEMHAMLASNDGLAIIGNGDTELFIPKKQQPAKESSMADENYQRLMRCSQCGATYWGCEQIEITQRLGVTEDSMCLHVACKNCHARFKMFFGERGMELMHPLRSPFNEAE